MAASAMKFPTYGANLVIDEATIARYSASLKGLTLEQSKLALSTTNLSAYEKELVLTKAGLITATDKLNISEAANLIQKNASGIVDAKALMLSAGLVTQKQIEENAIIQLTAANIEEAMSKGLLSVADAKVITSALGVTGVNFGEAVSFDVLTKAIWKNIAAMAKWLVTNPLGWVILGAGAIFGLVKGIDALTESTEEAGEAATVAKERYNEIESEIDSLNSKIKENNKLIAETNGDAQYDGYRKRLEAENKELERQIELERIKAQEAKSESDGKATKALTSETYEYDVKHTVNATGAGYTATSQKGDIATATDWYLDQAETTGVVSDKLKDYIETIKEQRENLDLLNPESKELYDNLGLLIDRYIALYPNVKVTSDGMADSSEKANEMTASLSEMKSASENISTLQKAFKELSDDGYITTSTLAEIQEATKLSGDEWDKYQTKLMNVKVGSADYNQIMAELTHKILDNTFAGKDLNDVTEDQIEAVLRENGVVNASAVAHDWLTKKKQEEKAATVAAQIAEGNFEGTLAEVASQCGLTTSALATMILKMINLNETKLNLSQQIAEIMKLRAAMDLSTTKLTSEEIYGMGVIPKQGSSGKYGYSYKGKWYNTYNELYKDVLYDKTMRDFGGEEEVVYTTPVYTNDSSKSGSDNKPDYEDPTDAKIRGINADSRRAKSNLEYSESVLDAIDAEENFQEAINQGNKVLSDREAYIDAIKTDNQEIHAAAQAVRDSSPHKNTDSWFDEDGEATEAYINFYNSLDAEGQKSLQETFTRLQKYKKAWLSNAEAINEAEKQSSEERIRISEWEENRVQKIVDEIGRNIDRQTKAREREIEALEHQITLQQSLVDGMQSYYDAQDNVLDARREINRELAASKQLSGWADEHTRQLLFNEDDYEELSATLDKIDEGIQGDWSWYQSAINQLGDDESEQAALITKEYERRLAMREKEYEIARAELNLAKKEQELNNILRNKNVKMVIGGQIQNVADFTAAKEAAAEVEDAKYDLEMATRKASRQTLINATQQGVDSIEAKKIVLEGQIQDLNDDFENLESAVEDLLNPIQTLGDLMTWLAGSIANNDVLSAATTVINTSKYGGSGGSTGVPVTPEGNYGVYGNVVFNKDVDYAAEMQKHEEGSEAWNSLNEQRNAKIDALGLDVDKYASGTASAKKGLAIVNEDGEELYIPYKGGTLHRFEGGEHVFNADQTKNLFALSQFRPVDLFTSLQSIAPPPSRLPQPTVVEKTSVGQIIINAPRDYDDFVWQLSKQIGNRPLK